MEACHAATKISLFIFTDEQRADTPPRTEQQIEWPNLNKLATRAPCSNARMFSTVCTPSRSNDHDRSYTAHERVQHETSPARSRNTDHRGDAADEYYNAYHGKLASRRRALRATRIRLVISIEDGYNDISVRIAIHRRDPIHKWLIGHGFRPREGETFGRGEATRLPEE